MRTPACSMRKRTGARARSISIDALEAGFFDFGFQRGNQRANGGCGSGQRGGRGLRVARGHIGERLRGVSGVERVGEQHGVVDCATKGDALSGEQWRAVFQSWVCLGTAASSSRARSSRGERELQCDARLSAGANIEDWLVFRLPRLRRGATWIVVARLPRLPARAGRHRERRQSRARGRQHRRSRSGRR